MNNVAATITPETRWLDADGVRMHYRVSGHGQPILLMHGWGCRADTLASVEAVVLRAGCKVYNVDFPGFGSSSEPPFTWGVEHYTSLIEKLIRKENIQNPTLLGHSFGGRVAILYASKHPSEVRRLVLVDAAGIKPRRSLRFYLKVYSFKAGKLLTKLFLSKEAAQRRIDAMRARRGSSDYAGASPMMRSILSKVVNQDLKSRLPLIKAPTLLIWGEADTATPLADAKTMLRLIPDAGLVSFPGCGHYSFLDNPGQFAAVLTSFLQS